VLTPIFLVPALNQILSSGGNEMETPTSTPRRPALWVPSRIHGQDPKSWPIAI